MKAFAGKSSLLCDATNFSFFCAKCVIYFVKWYMIDRIIQECADIPSKILNRQK
jgi:hypothetical protein